MILDNDEERTFQDANYTRMHKGFLTLARHTSKSCEDYSVSKSAVKKNYYACKETPHVRTKQKGVAVEFLYPDQVFWNMEKLDKQKADDDDYVNLQRVQTFTGESAIRPVPVARQMANRVAEEVGGELVRGTGEMIIEGMIDFGVSLFKS